MTNTYHTAIATGAAANASVFNAPLGQLDASIDDAMTFGVNNNAELVAARSPYASLAARLAAITGGYVGGNIATLTNGTAAAAQKVVTVDSTTGFLAGAYVAYTLVGGTVEYNTIDTVDSPTQLTLDTNIGTGGIGDNVYIGMISVSEYQAANVIPHANSLTLPQAIEYANGGVFNVRAYGALGDAAADDAVSINLAVDAARTAGGGLVYLPAGTYKVTAPIEIYDQDNLTFCGAGIEATIITSAATVDIDDPSHVTNAAFGTITVNTTLGTSAALNNVTLRDFTLKTSNSMDKPAAQKALYIGPVTNCLVERVKIDGSANEALYHDGYPTAALTSGIHVRDCEFTAFHMLGFNTNAPTNGIEISRCWFHDSLNGTHAVYGAVAGGGMNILGTNISVTGNRFESLLNHGILIATEGTGETWAQDVVIANNIFDDMGNVGAASMYAIYAAVTGAYADSGLLIANNVIGPIASSGSGTVYGIFVMGPWTVTGNVLSGVTGGAYNSDAAIVINKDAYSGTSFVVCTNNTIEAQTSSHKWSAGVFIENSVKVSALVANNLVRAGSIRSDGGTGLAYSDARGASIMSGNVFNAPFSIASVLYNDSNQYDNLGVTLGKTQRLVGPYFRQVVDGWYQDNVANSQAAVALSRSAGAAANGFVAIRAGYLTGVIARLSEASGGGTVSVEVFKNGSATGLIASIAPAYLFKATTQAPGTDSFVEGDVLDVRITTSGWSTTSADIFAAIEIET